LFHINTAQKYNGHKFRSFGTKTPKSYKPTHDDLFIDPNDMYIIFGHFIVVSDQYGQKMLRTKEPDPKYENLPKIETEPR